MVMVLLMLFGVAVVGSARPSRMVSSAREIVPAIEQRAASSSSSSADVVDDWSSGDSVGVSDGEFSRGGVVDDPVRDLEAESPPAQRQRDRSLWGMSKRLVPTGPNPLHN